MECLPESLLPIVEGIARATDAYLLRVQETDPGEYFGAFWSEKGYHGPALDYHAGGSRHHRGAGSAALALWFDGKAAGDTARGRAAELGFDWLASRQAPHGGFTEVQNNDVPSDWE